VTPGELLTLLREHRDAERMLAGPDDRNRPALNVWSSGPPGHRTPDANYQVVLVSDGAVTISGPAHVVAAWSALARAILEDA
jgi:hypothetical protein